MADDPDAELRRDLRALQQRYGRRLPERLAQLEGELRAARKSPAEAVAAARERAHTLKGTAGTYGFEALAERLERIEAALDALSRRGADAESLWREIDAALADAHETLAEGPTPVA